MEWSIQELTRAAGTTSRTLRHYQAQGLLEPSRVGSNGYRYYDQDSLLRLQRIIGRQIASVKTTLRKTEGGGR